MGYILNISCIGPKHSNENIKLIQHLNNVKTFFFCNKIERIKHYHGQRNKIRMRSVTHHLTQVRVAPSVGQCLLLFRVTHYYTYMTQKFQLVMYRHSVKKQNNCSTFEGRKFRITPDN